MDLQTLIKEVNKDIDDALPNGDITQWLNRALDDLTPVAKYKKKATIPLVSGQSDYELPTDLYQLEYVTDGKELFELALNDRTSRGYTKWGNTISIQPTPDREGEVTLYYYAQLPHLVDADHEPVIPRHYHDLLVLYAVARAKYQDEEPEMQVNAWTEYLAKKRQFEIAQNRDGEVGQVRLVT